MKNNRPQVNGDDPESQKQNSLIFNSEEGPLNEINFKESIISNDDKKTLPQAKGPTKQNQVDIDNENLNKNQLLYYFDIGEDQQLQKPMQFYTNKIKTSKYTWYNFLPKNLFFQLKKIYNAYFILIAILQLIKQVSTTGGRPSILVPLAVVLFISAGKDIIEDLKRSKADSEENESTVEVYDKSTQSYKIVKWETLKVGQIVKVKNHQNIPADLIFIASSSHDQICYVETKGLDGETSLKMKRSLNQRLKMDMGTFNLKGNVQCDHPNNLIYKFAGNLEIISKQQTSEKYGLNIDNLLLRGSGLRNTEYIIGLVTYAGHQTKIMQNSQLSKMKTSKNDKFLFRQVFIMFGFLIFLCLFASLFGTAMDDENEVKKKYLQVEQYHSNNSTNFFIRFLIKICIWIQNLQHLIPVTLFLTLDGVRLIYSYFIGWDVMMYDQQNDFQPKVQSSNLNEEIGQVTHIFTDKTGTLTQNIMNFKEFSAGSYSYGQSDKDCFEAMKLRSRDDWKANLRNVNFDDPKFYEHYQDSSHSNFKNINEILFAMSITHTVIKSIDNDKKQDSPYSASSPDEQSLVNAAAFLGYRFIDRNNIQNTIIIQKQDGKEVTLKVLHAFEFTSERKKMSVIVQDEQNKIKLYCKGADSVILNKLAKKGNIDEEIQATHDYLRQYGEKGMRTLVYARRDLDQSEYDKWNQKFININPSDQDQQLDILQQELENDFILLGSTSIEDVLQDRVEETIRDLKKANIKFWLLTGDKVETAISVSQSCHLLNPSSKLFVIDKENHEGINQQIKEIQDYTDSKQQNSQYSIVVTGNSLVLLSQNKEEKNNFIKLSKNADVVLGCRVSAIQKAELVKIVKENFKNEITLAIGDGANDVSMITEAHVGVGIQGKEGHQASRASDYALGQFQYLKNLLFVHGRESYRRDSYCVCYFYYKNILFVSPQFWFGIVNEFSGQNIYEIWIQQFYNIIFTSLPIIWYCIYDQQHDKEYLLNTPKAYLKGPQRRHLNQPIFWRYIIQAFLQSCLIMFLAFYTFDYTVNPKGLSASIFLVGQLIFCSLIFFSNFEILFQFKTHDYVSTGLLLFSILSFFLIFKIQDTSNSSPDMNGTFFWVWKTPVFYLTLIFVSFTQYVIQVIFEFAYEQIRYNRKQTVNIKNINQ
ncbi:phospholipid-translocating p-type flippase family [Stylonychia lemnae]|uniref:Phospholipid-transporting ATPase n=1 Tax=Stylonychia lemnae TaxID=5949 RepID=A0A078B115_STYLE|nr:phospholipid-translocating p-type flippase family [Stylonychia lemnae]|eukprot:CDW88026.1 phospholipid-translocating p-type flippase family [Stylonychia lemnae]